MDLFYFQEENWEGYLPHVFMSQKCILCGRPSVEKATGERLPE